MGNTDEVESDQPEIPAKVHYVSVGNIAHLSFFEGIHGVYSVIRRYLEVLLVSGVLFLAVVPLRSIVYNLSDVDSSSDRSIDPTLYVRQDFDRNQSRPKHVPDELIIKFRIGASEEEIDDLEVEQEAEEVCVGPFTLARVWKVPPHRTVEEWVSFFDKHASVEYAEPNCFRYALWYPNDPYYVYQWNFDDDHTKNPGGASSNPYGGANGGGIRMEEVWPITSGASNVVVAVIDTGVAYEDYPIPSYESNKVKGGVKNYQKAPDLAGTSFWKNEDEIAGNGIDDDGNGFVDDVNGWDFVSNDAHPNDNNAHGTHVTGTIAQTTNNSLGVAGIAFNTTIMPIKVLDYDGGGTDVWVANGIYYAVDNGARIINLSLGGPDPSTTLQNAVAYAYNHGVVVIAASGNDGTESVDYPAAYDDYVIAVGATRYDETRASYSDYGSSLDLVAPGGDVDVDQNGDGYGDGVLQQTFKPYVSLGNKADPTDWTAYYFFDGTSMATPHVSGVAALLLAQDSTLTPDQIRNALESTAEDLGASGRDDFYGWGLIDAKAALESVVAVPVVHLLLAVEPSQATYSSEQKLAFIVNVFSQFNPLEATLTFTVTGPSEYYVFDFERINMTADAVGEYSFDWTVPDVPGTYVVEAGLVPPLLTAYDAVWLEVV